jgi:hypothetical protein
VKRSSLERKSKKERRGFYSKLALCFLALIVAAACVVNAQEKISDFTYTYPQDPDYDPYPAQQDPDFIKLTEAESEREALELFGGRGKESLDTHYSWT